MSSRTYEINYFEGLLIDMFDTLLLENLNYR